MQSNLSSYSSSYGRLELHVCFKVKYCHPIFRISLIADRCRQIFFQVAERYGIVIKEIGFSKDHVHLIIQLNPSISLTQAAKLLKGTSGKKLLEEFHYLKRRYFWGSGLWSPAIYFDSLGREPEKMKNYVRNQNLS